GQRTAADPHDRCTAAVLQQDLGRSSLRENPGAAERAVETAALSRRVVPDALFVYRQEIGCGAHPGGSGHGDVRAGSCAREVVLPGEEYSAEEGRTCCARKVVWPQMNADERR